MEAHKEEKSVPYLLIVGEAPGEEEDRQGKPFVGPAGQLLRQALDGVGIDPDTDAVYTNIVRCRPPDNKIDKKYILACQEFLEEDIKAHQPSQIWLMGNSPLMGALGETGISDWNGSIVNKPYGELGEQTFIPLFHPAYILRNRGVLNSWLEAFMKAMEYREGIEPEQEQHEHIHVCTWDMLEDMRMDLLSFSKNKNASLYFDLETSGLDAFSLHSKIVAVGLSCNNGKVYTVLLDHKESEWEESDKPYMIKAFKEILKAYSGRIVGHNVKFDLCWVNGVWKLDVDAGGDTMLMSHLIDSRQGIHGLKRLSSINLGMYKYNDELEEYKRHHKEADPERGGSYANIPANILIPYLYNDVKAVILLEPILYEDLSEAQITHYYNITIPTTNTLKRLQSEGLTLDRYIAHRYRHIYHILQQEALQIIYEDSKVKKFTKRKNQEIEAEEDKRIAILEASPRKTKRPIKRRKLKEWIFNPGSSAQLRELYFNMYKIPVLGTTKKGLPSTSAALYRPLEGKHPILFKIRSYKLYTKALSTYLIPADEGHWLSDDGRVHTNFNQHGTLTGRLSSSKPINLQNIPTPIKEPGTILESLPIKNIFVHRNWIDDYGPDVDTPYLLNNDEFDQGALVSADFSGMELRVFASISNCLNMLDILASGLDVHSMVAIMSIEGKKPSEIEPEEVTWFKSNKAEVRYRYKWTNWTLLYGGNEWTLNRLYGIDLDEGKETIARYFEAFPEVREYQRWTRRFAEENGYIESAFGRRESLPYINDRRDDKARSKDARIAVNMPIQSTATDTLLIAANCLDRELRDRQLASKIVNTVHDSLVGDCPRYEIVPYALLCKDVMENVTAYAKLYYPALDFSWLRCALVADIDVGTNYGTEMSLKKWLEAHGDVYDKEYMHQPTRKKNGI